MRHYWGMVVDGRGSNDVVANIARLKKLAIYSTSAVSFELPSLSMFRTIQFDSGDSNAHCCSERPAVKKSRPFDGHVAYSCKAVIPDVESTTNLFILRGD